MTIVFCTLLGLIIGSFLNVVIHRLPLILDARYAERACDLTLAQPASHCPACDHRLRVRDNIPVVSWLLLRGRCAFCQAPISARYPLVELLSAALTVGIYLLYGLSVRGAAGVVLAWILICLAFIDLRTKCLPDELTLNLVWLGLLFSVAGAFATPADAIVGGAAGYASLWLIYMGFKLLTGKEGLGHGDMKLFAALGAFFGWQALPLIALLATCTGLALNLTLLALRKVERHETIPFGPHLALGGIAYLFSPTIHFYA